MKYINSQNDIPKEEHLAVFLFDTIHIPGDERSRTNPGHGYGPSSETTIRYIVFENTEEMEKWIGAQREYARFVPATVKTMTIIKTTRVVQ